MKFIKLENYNVVITDDADDAVELIPGGLIHSMTASPLNDVVSIKKLDGVVLPIAVASVTATKINPAAEVPFAGVNAGDLIDLLSADFFFVSVGSGTQSVDITSPLPLPVIFDRYEYFDSVARGLVSGAALFDKFGFTGQIGTVSAPLDVWRGGGLYTGFPATQQALEVLSSSALDTAAGTGARTVRITDLLDSSYNPLPDVVVALNGTTPVAIGSAFRTARVLVETVGSTGVNQGVITVRQVAAPAVIFVAMPALQGRTQVAAYTVPAGKTLYVDHVLFGIARDNGSAGSAIMKIWSQEFGKSWQASRPIGISTSKGYEPKDIELIFPEKTDIVIRIDIISDNSSYVNAEFSGVLYDN